MGCDGGTIPKRDELVKVKKRPEAKDKQAELLFQWRCCLISQEMLQTPIVTCGLGRLYNKSAVIEALLNRSILPMNAKHIRNLKDIKDLNLTPNPEYKKNTESREHTLDNGPAPYICAITGLEMSGKFRFVCLWSCGCVMSERAIKEINTKICHNCQKPFTEDDVIVLNAVNEDLELMQDNLKIRQELQKLKKKTKKTEAIVQSLNTTINKEAVSATISSSASSTHNNIPTVPTISIPVGPSSKSKRATESLEDPDIKKIKTDFSVAKDPKVTDVYKSLFTSHQSEKNQNRAHWVTYNPFYN